MAARPSIVVVTAGAAGIGRCISELFLTRGDTLHVCDVDGAALADFLATHPDATGTVADVSDARDVSAVFRDLQSNHGGLDVLVNNAGIAGPTAAVDDIDPELWDRTIAVNLRGPFLCTRLAVPLLKARGGAVINVASNAALTGCPFRAPYAASKWGVIGLTKTLAMELGKFDIRVNAICPCSVEGDRIEAVLERDAARLGKSPEELRAVYQQQSSLRRFVTADDVAEAAVFFASNAARNISGQVLGVDGHTESLANPFDP